jgi:hypothetical protein
MQTMVADGSIESLSRRGLPCRCRSDSICQINLGNSMEIATGANHRPQQHDRNRQIPKLDSRCWKSELRSHWNRQVVRRGEWVRVVVLISDKSAFGGLRWKARRLPVGGGDAELSFGFLPETIRRLGSGAVGLEQLAAGFWLAEPAGVQVCLTEHDAGRVGSLFRNRENALSRFYRRLDRRPHHHFHTVEHKGKLNPQPVSVETQHRLRSSLTYAGKQP